MSRAHLSSAQIRKQLGHPVIDGDGHIIEFGPTYVEYLKEVGGSRIVERFEQVMKDHIGPYWFNLDTAQRREIGVPRGPWWGRATKNTLDGATAMLPDLLRSRLDSFGIDFSVVYPTLGLQLVREEDEELRRATCRALNLMLSDLFRPHADRMTPAASIPMYTPKEAIEESEYAVQTLGMKTLMIAGYVRRPVPAAVKASPEAAKYTFWIDNLALDGQYDYDPFWQKCIDLKVAPTAHSAGMGWGSRVSPSNYVFNHIGLPVKLVIPQEGATYIAYEIAMLKNAPHPNAARLFMDFFLSEEAQLVYANTGNGITVKGVVDKATQDMRQLAGAKLLGTTEAARQDQMLALAKEIYK